VLIAIAGLIAWRLVRRLTGMRDTRRTLAEDATMLRHARSATKAPAKAS